MLVTTNTGAVSGVEGLVVRVEVDVGPGLQAFRVVGLPDAAVREAQVRVRAALLNSGFGPLEGGVTVNLAPANVRKQGTSYDLAVALGLVAAIEQAPADRLSELLCLGELALDGTVRSVRGVLPAVAEAAENGIRHVVVPCENSAEASLVDGVFVYPVASLRAAVDLLSGSWELSRLRPKRASGGAAPASALDLADVRGQQLAKRALEIAAAGGHNLLMSGPPGAGKSLLAARMPSLLPPLPNAHALEVTKIHSVAGLLGGGDLVTSPPFRAPHHTVSPAAMVGGGQGPTPGEVSLAHRGVLFLDELPEFQRPALEALRQPVEEGKVYIRRVDRLTTLPARFTLVGAMNPCPCGYLGSSGRPCRCTDAMVHRYQAKISGPLLDRIDLRVAVRRLESGELLAPGSGERSMDIRERVMRTRRLQRSRFRGGGARLNAFMSPKQVARHCPLAEEGTETLRRAIDHFRLSARAFHRVLKVSRTIADLVGSPAIESDHLQEALMYREGDGLG